MPILDECKKCGRKNRYVVSENYKTCTQCRRAAVMTKAGEEEIKDEEKEIKEILDKEKQAVEENKN